MRTKKVWRWILGVAFVPFTMATVFGTGTCTFSGMGSGDIDDGGGVIIIDEDD